MFSGVSNVWSVVCGGDDDDDDDRTSAVQHCIVFYSTLMYCLRLHCVALYSII